MPKLENKYWMCDSCGHRWYAEFSESCPKCHSKYRIRFFLDATAGKNSDADLCIGNYDPWLEKDISEIEVEIIPRVKRSYREKRNREKKLRALLKNKLPQEEYWPWDIAL